MFTKRIKILIITIISALLLVSGATLSVVFFAGNNNIKGDISTGAVGDPVMPTETTKCQVKAKIADNVNSDEYHVHDGEAFVINTEEEFYYLLGNNATTLNNKCFVLNSDIIMSGWQNIGLFNPTSTVVRFGGHFDGRGHKITYSLDENSNNAQSGYGLFPYVSGGTIENVEIDIKLNQSTNANIRQGFLGYTFSNAYIHNVSMNITMMGAAASSNESAGMVYETNQATLIEDCNITFTNSIAMSYTNFGGIVKNNDNSRISGCNVRFDHGDNVSLSYFGGITYQNTSGENTTVRPKIDNCTVTLPAIAANKTWNYLGGISYTSSGSDVTIEYCRVDFSEIKGSSFTKTLNYFAGIDYTSTGANNSVTDCEIRFGSGIHTLHWGGGVSYIRNGANSTVKNIKVSFGDGNADFRYFGGIAYELSGANSIVDAADISYGAPYMTGKNRMRAMGGVVCMHTGADGKISNTNVSFGNGAHDIGSYVNSYEEFGGIASYNAGRNSAIDKCKVVFGNGTYKMAGFGGIAFANSDVQGIRNSNWLNAYAAGDSGSITNCTVKFGNGDYTLASGGGITQLNGGGGAPLVDNCTVDFGSGDYTRTFSDMGGIVRHNQSVVNENKSASITNCSVKFPDMGTVAMSNLGGIARTNYYLIDNCSTKFPASCEYMINQYDTSSGGTGYVSGICGWTYTGSTISNCDTDMTISQNSAKRSYIAGIVHAAYGDITLRNCLATGDRLVGGMYTGGILGRYDAGGSKAEMSECYSTFVSIKSNNQSGGLIGHFYGGNNTNSGITIDNCGNWSDITGASSEIGGIIGYAYYRGTVTITNTVNVGNVSAVNDAGNAFYGNCAGFIGYINSIDVTTVTNCQNYGDVVGANNSAGFIGYNYYYSTKFSDCTNYGNVTGTSEVGGFIGYVQSSNNQPFAFDNVRNYGNITGTAANISGIVGLFSQANNLYPIIISMTAYNYGDVKGLYQVAGIISYMYSGAHTMTHLENHGAITATSSASQNYVGGLIGHAYGVNINHTLDLAENPVEWSNHGNITSGIAYTAGLVGYIANTNIRVGSMINTGNITQPNSYHHTAGLISCLLDSNMNNGVTVETTLTNSGNITGGGAYVAGGIGWMRNGEHRFTNFINYGAIVSVNHSDYTAGLIGFKSQVNSSSYANINNPNAPTGNGTGAPTWENHGNVKGGRYVGGLVGSWDNGYNKIVTATNTGNITGTGIHVAGIIGCVQNGAWMNVASKPEAVAEKVVWTNYGDVTTKGDGTSAYCAGIIGYLSGGQQKIDEMQNFGVIQSEGQYTAGLIGRITGVGNINFLSTDQTKWINWKSVTSTGDYTSGGIGCIDSASHRIDTFENYGTVAGKSYVGGLIGGATGTQHFNQNVTTPIIWRNKSAIEGSGTYVGGLIGHYNVGSVKLTKAVNFGEVKSGGNFAGGIVGNSSNVTYTTLEITEETAAPPTEESAIEVTDIDVNWLNWADVSSGGNYAGGIFGQISNNTHTMRTLENFGNVTAKNAYAAGIFGSATSVTFPTTAENPALKMNNWGNVVATGLYAGSISGYLYSSTLNVQSYVNHGKVVSGLYGVGGLIGWIDRSYVNILGTSVNPIENFASVTAANADGQVKNSGVGGIYGGIYGTTHTTKLSHVKNYGNVTLTAGKNASTNGNVGGIIGCSNDINAELVGVENFGNVSSSSGTAGGLVGQIFRTNNYSLTYQVRDFTNSGKITSSSLNCVGGLIGYAAYMTFNMEGTTANYGDVTAADGSYAGGMFGIMQTSTTLNLPDGFVNTGDITSGNIVDGVIGGGFYAGGLAGYSVSSTCAVTDFENFGDIIAYKSGAGGAFGYVASATYNLKNIANFGNVTAYGMQATGNINNTVGSHAGGFIGMSWVATVNLSVSADNTRGNINYGDIIGGYGGIGGIFGYINGNTHTYNNVYNYAKLVSNNGKIAGYPGGDWVGGIIGFSSATTATAQNVINYSNVYGRGNFVGGLYGRNDGAATLISSHNFGRDLNPEVVGTGDYVGGLMGYANTSVTYDYYGAGEELSASYNRANISGENFTGGLFGRLGGGTQNWGNLSNYGSVMGKQYVGGFVGSSENAIINMLKSMKGGFATVRNNGSEDADRNVVSGTKYVGGIFGMLQNNTQTMHYVYNHANIVGTGDYVGGLVGYYNMNNAARNFYKCVNSGNVSGAKEIGGLFGGVEYANINAHYDWYYYECVNYGDISGIGNIGGFFGSAKSLNTYQARHRFQGCKNFGVLKASGGFVTDGSNYGAGNVGGFVGFVLRSQIFIGILADANYEQACVQAGNISASNPSNATNGDGKYAGNLIGQICVSPASLNITMLEYLPVTRLTDTTEGREPTANNYYGINTGAGFSESAANVTKLIAAPKYQVPDKPVEKSTESIPYDNPYVAPNGKTGETDGETAYIPLPPKDTTVTNPGYDPSNVPTAPLIPDKPINTPAKPAKNLVAEVEVSSSDVRIALTFNELLDFNVYSLHLSVAGTGENNYTQLVHEGFVIGHMGSNNILLGDVLPMFDKDAPRPYSSILEFTYSCKTTVENVALKIMGKRVYMENGSEKTEYRSWIVYGSGSVTEIKE